jgi:hypothetical protein
MGRQRLKHEHRSLRFRVWDAKGNETGYAPAIVARRGPILFLVEPLQSDLGHDAIAYLSGFLEQHSPEIVFIVVTPDGYVDRIPQEAYDEIYSASDLRAMTSRIREQDPGGIVRPFIKPRPQDTTK